MRGLPGVSTPWRRRRSAGLLTLGRFPVVITVIAVRMVQAAVDNIIYMIAMLHRFMPAARTVLVVAKIYMGVAARRAVLVAMVSVGMMIFRHPFRCFR